MPVPPAPSLYLIMARRRDRDGARRLGLDAAATARAHAWALLGCPVRV